MRERLYKIIEVADDKDVASRIYDIFMMLVIVASIIPNVIDEEGAVIIAIDWTVTSIFVVDYIFRLITADYKLKKGKKSFVLYPITPMAIVDVVAILPMFLPMNSVFKLFKIFRLLRTLRVFRVFKFIRYSNSIQLIIRVLKKQKDPILVVGGLAIGYIIVSAVAVYSVEPESFGNFFNAIYWATVSLTTIGYGDIYAVSTIGKVITMISSIVGMGIVAMPAGIITAGFIEEINKTKDNKEEDK